MALKLITEIDRVEGITREEFQENYMKPQKPVIIKHLFGSEAPVYQWGFEDFKRELGHIEVGVYDAEEEQIKEDRSYKSAPSKMKFGDYLDLIQQAPTTKRLFLFDVFKFKKELKEDFNFPDIADNVFKFLPLAFFGGQGSVTRIHRDMDNSNVFLTELVGTKRVVLFDPKYSKMLYQYPFGTHTSIDVNDPDYGKYPALSKVEGYDVILNAGETVFMPSGWWHHIEYHSAGMGFAIRSLSPYIKDRLRGAYQIGVLTHLDELMRRMMPGNSWFNYKTNIAQKRANNAMR